jgi:glycosyltransferase involved in cell wall biosynthesis
MCTQEQLSEIYASADLLVFPSMTETFGNVTLESLASATPVLAYNSAAAGAFIEHDKNGWLAECDDAKQFVNCALDITQNITTLANARQHAHLSVKHLSWDEIASQVEALFQRAIQQG